MRVDVTQCPSTFSPGSVATNPMPVVKSATPSQPGHIIVSPSINKPKTAPKRTDPPIMIGILCVALTNEVKVL